MQLGYNLLYMLNHFELHINKSLAILVEIRNYANIKVSCLIVYFITDIVVQIFFNISSNFN